MLLRLPNLPFVLQQIIAFPVAVKMSTRCPSVRELLIAIDRLDDPRVVRRAHDHPIPDTNKVGIVELENVARHGLREGDDPGPARTLGVPGKLG